MSLKSWVDRLDRALELSIYYVSATLMLGMAGVILYAVVMRYFFNSAPGWSEEVPRVLFLWGSYLAVAIAAKRGQSLRIMIILERFPPLARLWLEMFMHTAIFVMLGFLLWHNIPVIQLSSTTRMLATHWPDALRYWPLSVGCVLIGLYQLRLLLRSAADYQDARRS